MRLPTSENVQQTAKHTNYKLQNIQPRKQIQMKNALNTKKQVQGTAPKELKCNKPLGLI